MKVDLLLNDIMTSLHDDDDESKLSLHQISAKCVLNVLMYDSFQCIFE